MLKFKSLMWLAGDAKKEEVISNQTCSHPTTVIAWKKKVQEINTIRLFHIPIKLSNEPQAKKLQQTDFEKIRLQGFSFIKQKPVVEAKLLMKYF